MLSSCHDLGVHHSRRLWRSSGCVYDSCALRGTYYSFWWSKWSLTCQVNVNFTASVEEFRSTAFVGDSRLLVAFYDYDPSKWFFFGAKSCFQSPPVSGSTRRAPSSVTSSRRTEGPTSSDRLSRPSELFTPLSTSFNLSNLWENWQFLSRRKSGRMTFSNYFFLTAPSSSTACNSSASTPIKFRRTSTTRISIMERGITMRWGGERDRSRLFFSAFIIELLRWLLLLVRVIVMREIMRRQSIFRGRRMRN